MNARAELRDVGTLDRASYIGGADISAIVGINPYRSPLDVYRQKVGEAPAEKPDPKRDARLRRGKLWEPIVVDMLREDHGIEVVARNHRYIDSEFPWMAAEIDFEWWRPLDSVEVLNGEIKSVHPLAAGKWGEAETEDVPMEHAAQSQWGLMLTGRELCQYGVVFGADDLTLYHVRRDDDVIAWLRDEAIRFWTEHVTPRIPPPPRTHEDLAKLWPRPTRDCIEATPEILALLAEDQRLRETARITKERRDEIGFAIGEFVKDFATIITRDGWPIATYKAQSLSSIDPKLLRAELPDVAARFTRSTEFRVLRHKAQKG